MLGPSGGGGLCARLPYYISMQRRSDVAETKRCARDEVVLIKKCLSLQRRNSVTETKRHGRDKAV